MTIFFSLRLLAPRFVPELAGVPLLWPELLLPLLVLASVVPPANAFAPILLVRLPRFLCF